jgi:hypothetical protein
MSALDGHPITSPHDDRNAQMRVFVECIEPSGLDHRACAGVQGQL